MLSMIKIIVLLLYNFQFSDLKLIYVFSENSIYNVFNDNKINDTKLEIKESGEYIIKGNCENASILINANYVSIYIINSHLNSGLNPLIIVSENKTNIIIYLNETILSSSFNSGIIQLNLNSNLIIYSKFTILKGGNIIKGKKKSNLKIKGYIGLLDKIKYISLNVNISEDFIFLCENEKIKFDLIYMEITSDSLFIQREFCIPNSYPFRKNISEETSYIFNKDIKFNIKIQKFFKNELNNKPNNIFYLDYLYFKHINIAKEKVQENILKKSIIFFKPKVSVIIPVYNVEKYLIMCINSIVKQSLKEIEIICVNDGSTDDSLFILLNYSRIDNRIMIIEQRNRGLSEARNTGVKYSNGEYIYFIDSDDYLEQNALFELYEYSSKNKLDSLYFSFSSFTSNVNKYIKKNNNINSLNYNLNNKNIMQGKYLYVKLRKIGRYYPSSCMVFYRKKFYIESGLSFYPGILHEDILFTLTGILLAKRTAFINKKYYYYRMRKNSILHTKINVKNLYGFFISYSEIVKNLNKIKFGKSVNKAINISKTILKRKIKKIMKFLSKKEIKILSIILSDNEKKLLSQIIKK